METGSQNPFTSMTCADPRLNKVINILNGDKRHSERKFGGGLLYCVNPFQLASDLAVATGFNEVSFQAMVILSHDDCAALNKNTFFANLRDAAQRLKNEGIDDEILFQVGALKKVAREFEKSAIPLYFGVVNTRLAQEINPGTTVEDVLGKIISWVDNKKPPMELFHQQ
jgi:peptide subunit release factor RF-3